MTSIYSSRFWHAKCVEPVKRNKDGLQWIIHRFPIKGGISIRDMMIREASRPNLLLKLVRLKDEE